MILHVSLGLFSCIKSIAHMILPLPRTCLRLSPTCLQQDSGCSARVIFPSFSHLSPLVTHLSPTRLWVLGPRGFTFVSHLSPLASHLSRTRLWMLGPRDFSLFLPLVSACRPLVSNKTLGARPAWFYFCLPLVSACLPPALPAWFLPNQVCRVCFPAKGSLTAWFHICLPLASTCQYTLDDAPHNFALASHLSPHFSPTTPWVLCPHDFTLVSTCLPVHSRVYWMLLVLWPAWLRTCLYLSLISIFWVLECSGPHDCALVSTCLPVHMIAHLARFSPSTLDLVSRLSPHFSTILWIQCWFRICFPLFSACRPLVSTWLPCLPVHPGCFERSVDWALVSNSAFSACRPLVSTWLPCLPLHPGCFERSADCALVSNSASLPVRTGCSECCGLCFSNSFPGGLACE